jgi:hypothetical protein
VRVVPVSVQSRTDTILAVRDYRTNFQPQQGACGPFLFRGSGPLFDSLYWCHNPARLTESWTVLWIGTALSEFLLQGPISAFVGAFVVGTKYEDVPFAENLGSGTC